jgi:hypothetical protein
MHYLDYSVGRLSPTQVRDAGFSGVIRYVTSPDRIGPKHITLGEYRELTEGGVPVLLVYEDGTGDADGGSPAGYTNALRAQAFTRSVGYTGPVFFCNDRLAVDAAAWRAYLDGAATVLGIDRVGAYGYRSALELAHGHAGVFWQCGRRADVLPDVDMWQDNSVFPVVGGVHCDRNEILTPPTPMITESDMTPEQSNRLVILEQLARSILRELTGSPTGEPTLAADMRTIRPGSTPGWPSLADGTLHTVADYARLIDLHVLPHAAPPPA